MAGSPKVELPATSPYPDVQPDDPDYAAIIWARQQSITSGWIDGSFHPDAQLSTRSIVAFLYRYQRSRGKVSPSLPTAAPQPRSGSLPGSKDSELSTKYWATDLSEGSAFGVNLGGLCSNTSGATPRIGYARTLPGRKRPPTTWRSCCTVWRTAAAVSHSVSPWC